MTIAIKQRERNCIKRIYLFGGNDHRTLWLLQCKVSSDASIGKSFFETQYSYFSHRSSGLNGIKMEHKAKSIRAFIGAKDFAISRSFYRDLGFEESVVSYNMSYFKTGTLGFYLQDAYVKDWVDNTMIFMEVEDVARQWNDLVALNLPVKYENVRLTPVRNDHWGRECFLHDPSGVLWHFGEFF